MSASLKQEVAPSGGTSAEMVAKCGSYMKEIAMMGVSILGNLKAFSNAKKCEKQLSNTGGAVVTTQQYCDKPENASVELCKCYKNPASTGCPNAVAGNSDSGNSGNGAGGTGLSIKGGSGVSGFASGEVDTTPDSNLPKGTTVTIGGGSDGARGYGGWGSGSGASSGSSSGKSGGEANAGNSAPSDIVKSVKDAFKKWDFGSFESFGGSGGTRGSAGALNGNSVGEKQLDAIKRKIASDQVAAEVSAATGRSNWEKVKRMYLIKENSLLGK